MKTLAGRFMGVLKKRNRQDSKVGQEKKWCEFHMISRDDAPDCRSKHKDDNACEQSTVAIADGNASNPTSTMTSNGDQKYATENGGKTP